MINELTYAEKVLTGAAAKCLQMNFDSRKATRAVEIALHALENCFMNRHWVPKDHRAIIQKMQDAVNTFRSNTTFAQNPCLTSLDREIQQLIKDGQISKQVFRARSVNTSLVKYLKRPFRALFHFFTKKITDLIHAEVYKGWAEKMSHEKMKDRFRQEYVQGCEKWHQDEQTKTSDPQALADLDTQLNKKLALVDTYLADHPELARIRDLEMKGKQAHELFREIGGKRIQLITSDSVELDATYLSADKFKDVLNDQNARKVNYTLNDGSYEFSGLSIEPDDPTQGVCLIEKLEKLGLFSMNSGYVLLRDKDRHSVIIGPEERQKLIESGVIECRSSGTYAFCDRDCYESRDYPLLLEEDFNDLERKGGRVRKINILGMDHPVIAYSFLENTIKEHPKGFVRLKVPEASGRIKTEVDYYLPEEEVDRLIRAKHLEKIDEDYKWVNRTQITASNYTDGAWREWKQGRERGVAILSSGNAGVYEMHKREALVLLLNGCDVMMLNLRGYGQSKGKPTPEGNHNDVEAAYQFIKQDRPGIPDKKIVAWSMCLSGGMAAHLAEKHSEMNLFLNQTYAVFWNIVKPRMTLEIKRFIKDRIQKGQTHSRLRDIINAYIVPLILKVIQLVTPDYNVKDRLAHIKGKVCVMRSTKDVMMAEQEIVEMKSALEGKKHQCNFVEIPGPHSTAWNQLFYLSQSNEIIDPDDYIKIDTWWNPKPFVLKKEVFSQNGLKFTENGCEHHIRYLNSKTVEYTTTEQSTNWKEVRDYSFSSLNQQDLPAFVKRFNLKTDKQLEGYRIVKKFLAEADLSRPLI